MSISSATTVIGGFNLFFLLTLSILRARRLRAALEEARQLLVTASGAGEYGKGDDWAKRYAAWQEAVRVLGVKSQ